MNALLRKMLARAYRAPEDDDGSNNGGGEAVGTGNDARVALLNSIGDSSEREREEELANVNDDDTTSQFKAPAAEVDEEARAEAEAAQVEADRVAAELAAVHGDEPPAKIVRKVNGQDMEITDELLEKASKIAAADVYLAEAKRTREALNAQQTNKEVEKPKVELDLASIARAIQMGTEEEAVAALQQLAAPKGPSSDDLFSKIDDRLTFNQAYGKFSAEYGDIVGDPVLKSLAQNMDARLIAEGDKRPYYDRYTEIGNSLRTWVASKAPAAAAPQSEKLERKAGAPAAVKPATVKHVPVIEEETEETIHDVIANMAAKRGGPQWMNGVAQG